MYESLQNNLFVLFIIKHASIQNRGIFKIVFYNYRLKIWCFQFVVHVEI